MSDPSRRQIQNSQGRNRRLVPLLVATVVSVGFAAEAPAQAPDPGPGHCVANCGSGSGSASPSPPPRARNRDQPRTVQRKSRQPRSTQRQTHVAVRKWNRLYQRGVRALEAGRPEEAVRRFQKAARLVPRNANTWNALGVAYQRSGRLREASDAYRRALAIRPGVRYAATNLAALEERMRRRRLAQALRRENEAIRNLEHHIEGLERRLDGLRRQFGRIDRRFTDHHRDIEGWLSMGRAERERAWAAYRDLALDAVLDSLFDVTLRRNRKASHKVRSRLRELERRYSAHGASVRLEKAKAKLRKAQVDLLSERGVVELARELRRQESLVRAAHRAGTARRSEERLEALLDLVGALPSPPTTQLLIGSLRLGEATLFARFTGYHARRRIEQLLEVNEKDYRALTRLSEQYVDLVDARWRSKLDLMTRRQQVSRLTAALDGRSGR